MYESFTDRARKIMILANEEAKRLQHEYIGTEHILLGLSKEGSGRGVSVIQNLGVDPRRILNEIDRVIVRGLAISPNPIGKFPATPRAKKVIEFAIEEAQNLKHDYVGSEHLLLGLLRVQYGLAAVVLMNFELTVDAVRTEVAKVHGNTFDVMGNPVTELQRVDEYDYVSGATAYSSKNERSTSVFTQFVKAKLENSWEFPALCAKCGQKQVVFILWNCIHIFGIFQEVINEGRAILAKGLRDNGPDSICLQCVPKWTEVHGLSLHDYELQLAKENAVATANFEAAGKIHDEQIKIRKQIGLLLEELQRTQ
jgi:hypothetical protein